MKKTSRPNIIFLVMDAVRAKNLSCYGYTRNTSPNISALAKQGVLFEKAFTSSNATDKSLFTILSGRTPLLKGKKDILLSKEDLASFNQSKGLLFSEILKSYGYKTHWLKHIYGWQKRGIDSSLSSLSTTKKPLWGKLTTNYAVRNFFRQTVHYFPKEMGDRIKQKHGRKTGEMVTQKALDIIDRASPREPFFLWVDYNNSHIPYNPGPFTKKFLATGKSPSFFELLKKVNLKKEMKSFFKGAYSKGATVNDIIARYDSALFHDDFLIGKVLRKVKEKGLMDNTIIVYFSDHGESFTTQNIFFDHHGLYDVCTHVPLLVVGKGVPKGKRITSFVQHEDLVPTVLSLANIPYHKEDFDGVDFFSSTKRREYVYAAESSTVKKRSVRTKKYRYIEADSSSDAVCTTCRIVHGGVVELYDIEKDPFERHNLASVKPKVCARMKMLLDQHVKRLKQNQEKRRLRSLLKK